MNLLAGQQQALYFVFRNAGFALRVDLAGTNSWEIIDDNNAVFDKTISVNCEAKFRRHSQERMDR